MDELISKHEAYKMLKDKQAAYMQVAVNEAFGTAARMIDQMKPADVQPAPKWISVKDRLPEAVEEDVNSKIAFSDFVLVYLVCDDGFTYITNDKCRVNDKSWLHEIPGEGCKVTHWMPLPEPPKDSDAE